MHSGKVRDLYAVGDDRVLMVASDRISAFDYILPTEIPDKGAILTALSLWWFDQLRDIVANHLITADVADYPAELAPHADELRGRSMLCRRLEMVPVECVARGYLTGSGFVDYTDTGSICGILCQQGFSMDRGCPEPIFTPATKAAVGDHDENVSYADRRSADRCRRRFGVARADPGGVRRKPSGSRPSGASSSPTPSSSSADAGGDFVIGDEVLTPDSSRFWPADGWVPGEPQPSYDKQYVRDWLRLESGWDRMSPAAGAARTRWSPRPASATSTRTRSSPVSAGPEHARRCPPILPKCSVDNQRG